MIKSDQYYFTDSILQLEINLHKIRRELILMIEEFEKEDCLICLQLKCSCVIKSPKEDSSFTNKASHDDSGNKSKEDTLNKAPPPDLVPKPKFGKEVESVTASKQGKKDIEAWIEASRNVQKAKTEKWLPTDVLLATLRKSWGESRNDTKKERALDDFEKKRVILDSGHSAASAVEVFFNSFRVQPVASAANMASVTNVVAIYDNYKCRSSEYTYF